MQNSVMGSNTHDPEIKSVTLNDLNVFRPQSRKYEGAITASICDNMQKFYKVKDNQVHFKLILQIRPYSFDEI